MAPAWWWGIAFVNGLFVGLMIEELIDRSGILLFLKRFFYKLTGRAGLIIMENIGSALDVSTFLNMTFITIIYV